jgi:sensor c-di-GMP phosphodiesterase-like protein
MSRRQLPYLALFLCATALGATLAFCTARSIQLRTGRDELKNYARQLLDTSPQLVAESDRAVATVLNAHLAFCSDEELALMRDYVYNAVHVKHIGRISNGMLYCTSGVGRLTSPADLPQHAEVSIDGLNVYRIDRIMISDGARDVAGLVVERRGVSTVINPNSYQALDEAPKFSSGFLIDPRNSRTTLIFGHFVAMTGREIASGDSIERGGIFLQPLCSKAELICVVASESRADILAATSGVLYGFLIGGTMLVSAASLILILVHKRRGCLEQQLRRALRKDGFSLVYQPIVELDSGAVVGAEALIRWIDEAGRAVSPEIFIALAEEKEFVSEITQWVIRRVTRELGDVLANGGHTVSINVSSQDLVNPEFFATLEECMQSARLAPGAIGLEITERSTADHETVIDAIARLKRAGHTVYVDDFGTGFSSLAYLHRLTADAIKIDRVFTGMVGADTADTSIVPQILAMAALLSLRVVVEGIETREQADYFRAAAGHALAQGYFFSRGVPAAEIKKIFSKQAPASAQIAETSNVTLQELKSTAA